MDTEPDDQIAHLGRYKPSLILHGGAGAISRAHLPPDLYQCYHNSLVSYLTATRNLLDSGSSALDAACHAVSLLEDDPLFNCGRGSVFTTTGKIEMEASVMVASISENGPPQGGTKRSGAVSGIRNTRHPILLAKQVLLEADEKNGLGGPSSMHCHLNGLGIEEWGWKEKKLERKEDDWFWTKKRWDEHRRGLEERTTPREGHATDPVECEHPLPSQGTVGAVCLDNWGNMAVATSTGGLTNKAPGRVGDTPSVGAGFWAESWEDEGSGTRTPDLAQEHSRAPQVQANTPRLDRFAGIQRDLRRLFTHCLPSLHLPARQPADQDEQGHHVQLSEKESRSFSSSTEAASYGRDREAPIRRRLVAMSGTGNGDSFLRVNAIRSAAAIARFSSPLQTLQQAIDAISGPGGELQKSAGDRWMRSGEGQGGIIGIELLDEGAVHDTLHRHATEVVFAFNCNGLWRAWYVKDPETGKETPKVMVFREEYRGSRPEA